VKQLAEARLADIDRKIEELRSMRDTLSRLVDACRGDHRPDCPILDDLAKRRPALD
jgi:MerR family transcriptional regulator, copper efflux regulator